MKKQAVGYVRVSGIEQVKEGTSLEYQRGAIQKYAKEKGWELGGIYADEGISGAEMEKREGLLRLLRDAANGKFNVMICTDMDCFGRDLRDSLNNLHMLAQCGVEDHFTSSPNETPLVKNFKALLAQEEKEKTKERTMRGRLIKLREGSPQGRRPFNRTYDKKTGEWGFVDKDKNKLIRWAAEQYLQGGSLHDIASDLTKKGFKICPSNLTKILSRGCGDRFINTLQGTIDGKKVKETYEHKIPRILPQSMIQAIRDRMDHNLTNNRKDVRKYVLTGFIRCEFCEKSMSGQTIESPTKHYRYYTHPGKKGVGCCPGYKQLPMDGFEKAVFKTLWEQTFDTESYWEAVAKKAPDDIQINTLKASIKYNEKGLKEIKKDMYNLTKAVLTKTIGQETAREMDQELRAKKDKVMEELDADRKKLESLPTLKEFEHEVKAIREMLLKKYRSLEHLEAMTYKQKRRLLHTLFDGKDESGKQYGIYVRLEHRNEKRKHFRFYIYARIFACDPPPYGSFVPGRPEDFDLGEVAEKQQRLLNKKRKESKTGKRRKGHGTVKERKRRNEYKTKSLPSK